MKAIHLLSEKMPLYSEYICQIVQKKSKMH